MRLFEPPPSAQGSLQINSFLFSEANLDLEITEKYLHNQFAHHWGKGKFRFGFDLGPDLGQKVSFKASFDTFFGGRAAPG